MDLGLITILLIVLVAFLAGLEGVLDQFQFHQPIVACTLVGLVSGHLKEGMILGGTLQIYAAGWANVGAAVAPDAALASVASAVILMKTLAGGSSDVDRSITVAIAAAIPLSVAGLFLTMICRTIAIPIVHLMDGQAEKGNIGMVSFWHIVALAIQGIRIAIPALLICLIPAEQVVEILNYLPDLIKDGMAVGGGMVAAVGYAMVINMMATSETWAFFILGFVVATISDITLIGLGAIGVALAIIYLALKEAGKNNGGGSHGDPLGDILNDY